ncbi:MYB DNA-binding domain protein [Talaromyces proteolyticus]|uniref:MYB DNA-binding domain protein n=1 Tax=Talaromyces proteolyticus TaxID=1131652 RepID=A0AAD4KSZ1_9EURO|nr:MYB DNA-binding domain protein [Talaromyces proteolyticus]KAH8700348.1 MYB DNA-binding domain protein [Talaromyces proteolyticus]
MSFVPRGAQQSAPNPQHHQQPGQHVSPPVLRAPLVQDVHSQPLLLNPHQMAPSPISSHYGSNPLQFQPARAGKRPRVDGGDGNEDDNRLDMHLQMLKPDAHGEGTQSPEMLMSAQGDSSSQHRPSAHSFALPPPPVHQQQQQQHHHHHHHRLPPQALIHPSQQPGGDMNSPNMSSGLPSVVGQAGMPDPAPRPRGPKLKFTPEEDGLLVELKEHKNLTWKQISDFFPGRTSGTLQVRYCTKLKAKDTVWTDEMEQRLRNAIQDYENDRWRIIAGKVGHGFTPAACREKATEL